MFEYRLSPANFDEILGENGIEMDKGSIVDWYDGVRALLFKLGDRSYYSIDVYWDLVEYDHFKVYALFELIDCDIESYFLEDDADGLNQKTLRFKQLYSSKLPLIPGSAWNTLPIQQLMIGGCLLSNFEKLSREQALVNFAEPLIVAHPEATIIKLIQRRVKQALNELPRKESTDLSGDQNQQS